MSQLKVTRSLHIEQSDFLEEAIAASISYVSLERDILVETVDFGGQRECYFRAQNLPDPGVYRRVLRRSEDNGKTWTEIGPVACYVPLDGNRRLQRWFPLYVLNSVNGTLLEMVMAWEDIEGLLPWDPASPTDRTGRIFLRYSKDHGMTWSREEPLVMTGGEYDSIHWGPQLFYGQNGVGELGETVYIDEKTFLIPFRTLLHPKEDPGHVRTNHCSCLIGTWRPDGKVEWGMSSYVTVPSPLSVYGGCEPSVVRYEDGTLVMTMRVLVHQETAPPGISGTRYVVTSRDLGKTWSDPEPLRFEDGQLLHNPACLGQLFHSTKNNRLYLISNILDRPVFGHDPRYPLCIAEIDRSTLRLKRHTLTTIETRDETRGQPETIRFSNWAGYEDRKTKNLFLFITGCPGNTGRHETCGVSPHSFRYEIELPNE
jgi:hypothetical protein